MVAEELKIIVRAEVDRAVTALKKTSTETGKLKTGMHDAKSATSGLEGGLKDLGKIAPGVANLLGAAGVAGAVMAAASAFKAAISEMREMVALADTQMMAEVRLAAVIRATGGAAGISALEMRKMASALQEVTTFGDETTLQAMALLSTFRSIQGPVFERTIELAMDLASVMNTDLSSATLQLGKALEDPKNGLTALRRSGVSFTDEQKDVITAMVDTGHAADAQGVILDTLSEQVGGTARALADTSAGERISLKAAIGDVREELGFLIAESAEPWVEQIAARVKAASGLLASWRSSRETLTATFDDIGNSAGRTVAELEEMQQALRESIEYQIESGGVLGGLALLAALDDLQKANELLDGRIERQRRLEQMEADQAMRQRTEQAQAKAISDQAEAVQAVRDKWAETIESVDELREIYTDTLDELNELLEDGLITQEEYDRQIQKNINDTYRQSRVIRQEFGTLQNMAADFGITFADPEQLDAFMRQIVGIQRQMAQSPQAGGGSQPQIQAIDLSSPHSLATLDSAIGAYEKATDHNLQGYISQWEQMKPVVTAITGGITDAGSVIPDIVRTELNSIEAAAMTTEEKIRARIVVWDRVRDAAIGMQQEFSRLIDITDGAVLEEGVRGFNPESGALRRVSDFAAERMAAETTRLEAIISQENAGIEDAAERVYTPYQQAIRAYVEGLATSLTGARAVLSLHGYELTDETRALFESAQDIINTWEQIDGVLDLEALGLSDAVSQITADVNVLTPQVEKLKREAEEALSVWQEIGQFFGEHWQTMAAGTLTTVQAFGDMALAFSRQTVDAMRAEMDGMRDAQERQLAWAEAAGASDKELATIKAENLDKRMAAEEEFAKARAEQMRKEAIFQKAMSIAQITMNTAQAVSQYLAIPPLAIAMGALGAAQIAAVMATPIPEYEKGGSFVTNGPQAIMVGDGQSPRERVTVEPLSGPYARGGGSDRPIVVNVNGIIDEGIAIKIKRAIMQAERRGAA